MGFYEKLPILEALPLFPKSLKGFYGGPIILEAFPPLSFAL